MTKRKGTARETLVRMRAAAGGGRSDEAETSDTVPAERSSAAEQPSQGAPQSAPRRKPGTMRYTIDLTPEDRRKLHIFALDNGIAQKAAVVRTLIGLLEDPVVSDRVLDRLQAGQQA